MALNNIDPQTFIVPDKQVLLYVQDGIVYYKRYTNTVSTLDDKTLKALGIAKQQLPCLIYDADLLKALTASIAMITEATIAHSAKASLESIKIASTRKLDKYVYLTDQVQLKQTIKDINNRFETLTRDYQEVSTLFDNKIIVPKKAIPIAIKTNKGTLYNIDFRYIAETEANYQIDPSPYLAYDNQQSFSGTWTVYYAGLIQRTKQLESSVGTEIKTNQNTVIMLEHNKVIKHTVKANQNIAIDITNTASDVCTTMQLWLTMEDVVSFQLSNVFWVTEPSFSIPYTVYAIVLRWDGGRVIANLAYKVPAAASQE